MEFQADIFLTYFFFLCLKLLHCASFALALLGFIYNNLAEKEIGTKIGKVSVGKFSYCLQCGINRSEQWPNLY